jgi:transposase
VVTKPTDRGRPQVRHDATAVSAVMLGLPGFVVLAAAEVGGELELVVETTGTVTGCPDCGVVATPHARRDHLVRDIPAAGRPVLLLWRKRIWRCDEPRCVRRTWSETTPLIRPRAALTERARWWACQRVGRDGDTVAAVSAELGVGWNTVMRAVRDYGRPLVDDPRRLEDVSRLGVDEHVWQHATRARRTQFATGIVDLSAGRPPRLLDVVAGRTGKVYADWLAARDPAWRERIGVAALDPFRGYATALRTELPHAIRVLDPFHVVRLGLQALDEVRRRVQQETLGHRGHKHDPLFTVRRLLRRGAEHLTAKQRARLEAALQAGDPNLEVTVAWHCAQQLRSVYRTRDLTAGRRQAEQLLDRLHSCPVPEIARLGRTLRAWRTEFLAYFDTDRVSNGPSEAMNLLVEKTRRIGHGFRNFANYRLRLLLHCGVDWQTPHTPRVRTRRPRLVA